MEDYTEIYYSIFNTEKLDIIQSIERTFNLLEYDHHKDELWNMECAAIGTGVDVADDVINIYSKHINDCLKLQGVHLDTKASISFQTLVIIFNNITLIGSEHAVDILSTIKFSIEESSEEVVAKIIANLAEVDMGSILSCISRISDNTITVINNIYNSIHEPPVNDMRWYKDRLTNYGSTANVRVIINDIGILGYDLKTTLLKYIDEINTVSTNDRGQFHNVKRSVSERVDIMYKIALGSTCKTTDIKDILLNLSEYIALDGSDLMELNAELRRLKGVNDDNS